MRRIRFGDANFSFTVHFPYFLYPYKDIYFADIFERTFKKVITPSFVQKPLTSWFLLISNKCFLISNEVIIQPRLQLVMFVTSDDIIFKNNITYYFIGRYLDWKFKLILWWTLNLSNGYKIVFVQAVILQTFFRSITPGETRTRNPRLYH